MLTPLLAVPLIQSQVFRTQLLNNEAVHLLLELKGDQLLPLIHRLPAHSEFQNTTLEHDYVNVLPRSPKVHRSGWCSLFSVF